MPFPVGAVQAVSAGNCALAQWKQCPKCTYSFAKRGRPSRQSGHSFSSLTPLDRD
jgi:hypothetical protein